MFGVVVAVLTTTGLLGSVAAQPVDAHPAARTSARTAAVSIDWRSCRDGFQCARVEVPLDYDAPDGEQISLSVIRLPAGDPSRRIGSLFLNPGGPGGSGVDITRWLAQVLPLELRGRFDIVGFDPRGVLRSTPLRCFRTFGGALRTRTELPFPRTTGQENAWIASDRKLATACRERGGKILAHMSTADVARDMDALRAAMGDARLNYLGFSYGSMLGQTYANLFPEKTRAIVIDGVIDPRAWAGNGVAGTTVPVGTRLRSAAGAAATLHEFFRLCDEAGRRCKFSGSSPQRFQDLARALKAEPLRFGDGFKFTYNDLIAITLGGLYASSIFPELALFLRDVERAVVRRDKAATAQVTASLARIRDSLGLARPQQKYPNYIESFPGVTCSDGKTPRDYELYRSVADAARRDMGHFARLWHWSLSACAVWPERAGKDQYLRPWTAATAQPVLVVGNHFDPATRYKAAVAVSQLLPNSRLLAYAGPGHTAFFSGNFCVDQAVTNYLETTVPPPSGTVCRPAGSPFGISAAGASAVERPQAGLGTLLPPAVRRVIESR